MKIVVFDNNKLHNTRLSTILKRVLDKHSEIIFNPEFKPNVFKEKEYENALFFIDTTVKLPSRNFLSMARKLRETNESCHICFMSESSLDMVFCYQKAIRPSGFLIKPVDENDLSVLVDDIMSFEPAKKESDELYILIKTREKSEILCIGNVLYFTAFDKKIICVLENGEEKSFYGTLGKLEDVYNNYFLRCHSGFLVNRSRIESFSKSKMLLTLKGCGENIPVSKSRCKEVESFIKSCDTQKMQMKI